MEINPKMLIIGAGVLVFFMIFFRVFEISLREPSIGIYEIAGKRGEHSVDLSEDFNVNSSNNSRSNLQSTIDNALSGSHDIAHPNNVLGMANVTAYQGTPLPLNDNDVANINVTSGPSIDGTKNTPPSMLMFKYNQCKPECCPGPYSCDRGCICTSRNQQDFIARRGKND